MAQSSDEFHRLLRLLQEQHEQELAVLAKEVAKLQMCAARYAEATPGDDKMTLGSIKTSGVHVVIAELPTVSAIDSAKQRTPPLNRYPDTPVSSEEVPSMEVDSAELDPDDFSPMPSGSRIATSLSSRPSGTSIPEQSISLQPIRSILKGGHRSSRASRARSQRMTMGAVPSSAKRFKLFHGWHPCFHASSQRQLSFKPMESARSTTSANGSWYDDSWLSSTDKLCAPLMIDPASKVRTLWSIGSLVVLCYEIAVTPPECFIGFSPPPFMLMMRWVTLMFWTLDVPLNFLTRVYAENGYEFEPPSAIAVQYLRTWLLFDVTLVGSDWFFQVSKESGDTNFVAIFRSIRLLRMSRLLRVARVRHIVSDLLNFAPDIIVGCAELLKLSICMGILIHVFACCWFSLGTLHNGWASKPEIVNASVAFKYTRALFWTISCVHGSTTVSDTSEPIHYTFAIFIISFGFISMAMFIGKMSHAVVTLSDTRRAEMKQICRNYLRTRNVSPKLQLRLYKFLAKCHQKTFKEEVERENEVLTCLPVFLSSGLQMEIRAPLLLQVSYFREVCHRMLRMLCGEALTCVVALQSELVFDYDIVATQMFWVESGKLIYAWGVSRRTPLNRGGSGMDMTFLEKTQQKLTSCIFKDTNNGIPQKKSPPIHQEHEILTRGTYLCEPAMWTEWFHCGSLYADSNVTLLSLDVNTFIAVIGKMPRNVTITINYATRYLTELNLYSASVGKLSDILAIDVDFADIHEPSLNITSFHHLVFLSHFKEEAGAEAALMEEYLNKLIREDPEHPASSFVSPCFLDSENLIDLCGLRDHVRNSANLLVLLTPGILTRPWCLIEIVTAVRNEVNLVPVEIQRPGLSFQYPDDQFYEALSRGKTLTQSAIELLKEECVDLVELTACVRQVFNKIALPFSPHKSTKIRQAEMCDILSRCVVEDGVVEDGCEQSEVDSVRTLSIRPLSISTADSKTLQCSMSGEDLSHLKI